MNRTRATVVFGLLLAAIAVGVGLHLRREQQRANAAAGVSRHYVAIPPRWKDAPVAAARAARPRTAAEKAAFVERVRRDYDEIRSKAAADYTMAGTSFPGGLNAFLRQLAMLEGEKRRDLLTVLTPAELEDIEMQQSHAGELVRRWLGDTAATEAQRRAVFRLQQEFDDRFALTFDLSPAFLLARERERQALQDSVHAALGDALFGSWLRAEGTDYATFVAFASGRGLAPDVPMKLWQMRNVYTLSRLELSADQTLSPEDLRVALQTLTLTADDQARSLLGIAASDPSATTVLAWLPKR